jgi:cell division protein FtsB
MWLHFLGGHVNYWWNIILLMKKKKRVAKAKKSSKVGRRPRGKAKRSPAVPRVRTGKEGRGSRDFRVIEGGRQMARKSDKDSRQPARKRKTVSPLVRRRRRLAAFFFVLAAAGLVTYLLLGPILRNIDSRRNLTEIENKLEMERAKTRELQERMETAQSKEYVEDEARGMNYVKPGEIPIIVLDDEEAPDEGLEEPTQPETSTATTP